VKKGRKILKLEEYGLERTKTSYKLAKKDIDRTVVKRI